LNKQWQWLNSTNPLQHNNTSTRPIESITSASEQICVLVYVHEGATVVLPAKNEPEPKARRAFNMAKKIKFITDPRVLLRGLV
jgi:hypothetical protein